MSVCSHTSIHYWRSFQNVSGFLKNQENNNMLHFCTDMIKANEGGREEFLKKALLGEKGGIMSFKMP